MSTTTDHSILCTQGNPLPFEKEATLVTRVLRGVFVELPNAFASALRARHTYERLALLDNAALATLGIERDGIARYALENSGLLNGDRR